MFVYDIHVRNRCIRDPVRRGYMVPVNPAGSMIVSYHFRNWIAETTEDGKEHGRGKMHILPDPGPPLGDLFGSRRPGDNMIYRTPFALLLPGRRDPGDPAVHDTPGPRFPY